VFQCVAEGVLFQRENGDSHVSVHGKVCMFQYMKGRDSHLISCFLNVKCVHAMG
jgi:hypothetical protein